MDSSSDESFAWEKASSGSDDEDNKHTEINGNDINVEHAQSYDIGDEEKDMAKEPKAKKRKHRDKENSSDEVESPRKKKIKTEPESDSDAKKKKKKNSENMSIVNGYCSNAHELDHLNDEEYLNMCVKQEQKSKKKQDNDDNDVDTSQEKECDDLNIKKEKKKKKKKHSKDIPENIISENDLHNTENNDYLDNSVVEMHDHSRKSSKKKKSKENRVSDRIETHNKDNESSSKSPKGRNVIENNDHVSITKTHEYKNENPKENDYSSNSEDITQKQLLNSKIKTPTTLENGSPKKKLSIIQTTPAGIQNNNSGRLLDRICFEEDLDSDSDVTHSYGTSSYLRKYLKQNENMQQISRLCQNGSEITNDDEIWILKCPHDIDIHKLHDTDFSLESKSKIKINGETYCGNLDESKSKITIMTSDTNNFIIKNIVANGTIHFRKRLPKPHVQQDNTMVNNQTDFIPLPETKCRHPLFGSNYKEAIKVRVRRERVESAAELEVSTTLERKKKKKHKKEHCIKPKIEIDNDTFEKAPKVENDSDVPVKKAKKKKHTSNDESFKKQSKKIKIELDSAEAWESEKAIEENLFNF